ncbi:MAG: class F sortase [Nocardioidaceae bacterium]|nr:class F sortase [Nocardioidaceae bacterium]
MLLLLSAALALAAFALPGSTSAAPVAVRAESIRPVVPMATLGARAPLVPLPRPARPTELVVPVIGVHADVERLVVEGTVLTPPADVTEVGWWSGGPRPGSRQGHVLITGHTVHTGGGVFNDLGDLRAGDAVRVGTVKGPMDYRVTRVRYLSVAELAAASGDLFALTGPPRLVLVTCAGWDGVEYHGNTVVIAKPATGAVRPGPARSPSPAASTPSYEPTSPVPPGLIPLEAPSYH